MKTLLFLVAVTCCSAATLAPQAKPSAKVNNDSLAVTNSTAKTLSAAKLVNDSTVAESGVRPVLLPTATHLPLRNPLYQGQPLPNPLLYSPGLQHPATLKGYYPGQNLYSPYTSPIDGLYNTPYQFPLRTPYSYPFGNLPYNQYSLQEDNTLNSSSASPFNSYLPNPYGISYNQRNTPYQYLNNLYKSPNKYLNVFPYNQQTTAYDFPNEYLPSPYSYNTPSSLPYDKQAHLYGIPSNDYLINPYDSSYKKYVTPIYDSYDLPHNQQITPYSFPSSLHLNNPSDISYGQRLKGFPESPYQPPIYLTQN